MSDWTWLENKSHFGLVELHDARGVLLAWITRRPPYCDRGHFQVNVECVTDLDEQDGFPRYYMRFEIAQQETEDFLRWRLLKERTIP